MKQTYIFPLLLLLASEFAYTTDGNIWIEVKGGEWSPTHKEVVFIKSATKQAVQFSAQKLQRQLKAWDSYTFQYQGMSQGGHKFVYVNAFCKENSFENLVQLSAEFLVVMDGGTCYFQFKYDPINSKFYDVSINGEA